MYDRSGSCVLGGWKRPWHRGGSRPAAVAAPTSSKMPASIYRGGERRPCKSRHRPRDQEEDGKRPDRACISAFVRQNASPCAASRQISPPPAQCPVTCEGHPHRSCGKRPLSVARRPPAGRRLSGVQTPPPPPTHPPTLFSMEWNNATPYLCLFQDPPHTPTACNAGASISGLRASGAVLGGRPPLRECAGHWECAGRPPPHANTQTGVCRR